MLIASTSFQYLEKNFVSFLWILEHEDSEVWGTLKLEQNYLLLWEVLTGEKDNTAKRMEAKKQSKGARALVTLWTSRSN